MKTYIPKKHYKTFWKSKLFGVTYGMQSALVKVAIEFMKESNGGYGLIIEGALLVDFHKFELKVLERTGIFNNKCVVGPPAKNFPVQTQFANKLFNHAI